MDHAIVINTNSFPAKSREQAIEYFKDAIQGVLELNTGSDRYIFYLDFENKALSNFILTENYTYADFLNDLDDVDLLAFLQEVEDKSPALDSLTEEEFQEVASYHFYLKDQAIDKNQDIFSIAWVLSATILSIPTDVKWDNHFLNLARTDNGEYIHEHLKIKNIARTSHGTILYNLFHHKTIHDICSGHFISIELSNWFNKQSNDNQRRILEKFELAVERKFQGGKPLFETLTNADGVRELRFSAYPSGATRILFRALTNGRQALLVGFIKKNKNEGYTQAINDAKKLYDLINVT